MTIQVWAEWAQIVHLRLQGMQLGGEEKKSPRRDGGGSISSVFTLLPREFPNGNSYIAGLLSAWAKDSGFLSAKALWSRLWSCPSTRWPAARLTCSSQKTLQMSGREVLSSFLEARTSRSPGSPCFRATGTPVKKYPSYCCSRQLPCRWCKELLSMPCSTLLIAPSIGGPRGLVFQYPYSTSGHI